MDFTYTVFINGKALWTFADEKQAIEFANTIKKEFPEKRVVIQMSMLLLSKYYKFVRGENYE